MGILNVTPDSFSDGGSYFSVEDAVERASTMIGEGASIIDVGGASSRPAGKSYGAGAGRVSVDEEIKRIEPVISQINKSFPDIIISVDTFEPEVAQIAVASGADMVNDITGMHYSRSMAQVVADSGAAIVLMHSHGTPGQMPHEQNHDDVLEDVREGLISSLSIAYDHDIHNICIDPGFGFGKTMDENFSLLNRLGELLGFGLPLLAGISRKTMIGAAVGTADEPLPHEDRVVGSVVAAAAAVLAGASIIRTHDVVETIQMLKVLTATETERLV
ncbi:MAG: dihydropteroate synthase [Rhodothermales bacterium]|nr:dihydropteroate synthase [Rhodothermales bacterium]